MAKTPTEPKPRPANPACDGCDHPGSFHPKVPGKRNRPCKAFGCTCKAYKAKKAASKK